VGLLSFSTIPQPRKQTLFNPVQPVVVLTPDFFVFCNLAGKDAGQNNTKLLRGLSADC
jgi:hypothetical protein